MSFRLTRINKAAQKPNQSKSQQQVVRLSMVHSKDMRSSLEKNTIETQLQHMNVVTRIVENTNQSEHQQQVHGSPMLYSDALSFSPQRNVSEHPSSSMNPLTGTHNNSEPLGDGNRSLHLYTIVFASSSELSFVH